MTYLFSDEGRVAFRNFVDCDTLFAFDLDGTLAPIVPDPDTIEIPAEIVNSLIELDRIAKVAIITGRNRADALAHLGFTPRFIVGNHGAEGLPGCDELERVFAYLCRGWKKQLERVLPELHTKGVVLEDKGATLTLHYRNTPDRQQAHREILDVISRLIPTPRRVSGKFVENIVPRNAPHKGQALQVIMRHSGCRHALFVGDDITDEDVFRLGNPAIIGIRVGKKLESSAGFYLERQQEIVRLLQDIIALLHESVKPTRSNRRSLPSE